VVYNEKTVNIRKSAKKKLCKNNFVAVVQDVKMTSLPYFVPITSRGVDVGFVGKAHLHSKTKYSSTPMYNKTT
jgi:hypothetical protein